MESKMPMELSNLNSEQLEKMFAQIVSTKYLRLNDRQGLDPHQGGFTQQDNNKIKKNFLTLCPDNKMNYELFRSSLGLLGSEDFFIRRLFNLIDSDKDNIIKVEDFHKYLNTIFNGSAIAKAFFGWKMLAGDKEYFEIADMWELFYEISMLWNALTGEIVNPKKEYIEQIFNFFDLDQDQTITFEDYQIFFQEQPLMFGWFEFLNNFQIGQSAMKIGFSKGRAELQQKRRSTVNKITNAEQEEMLRQHKQKLLKKKFKNICNKLKEIGESTKKQNFKISRKLNQNRQKTSPLLDISFKSGVAFLGKPYETPTILRELTKQQKQQEQEYTELINHLSQPKNIKSSAVVSQPDLNTRLSSQLKQILNRVSILQTVCKELAQVQERQQKSKKERKKMHFKLQYINKQLQNLSDREERSEKTELTLNRKNLIVYFGHENWNLVLNLMVGMRRSIKALHQFNEQIELKQFHFTEKYQFLLCNKVKLKDQQYFKFQDFFPLAFEKLRINFGITNQEYQRSVGPEGFIGKLVMGNLTALNQKCSSGKSGSFFYQTADDKYLLKTIPKSEYNFLKSLIKNYYNHLIENKNSLIVKIFGLHKIKSFKLKKHINTIYFISMENIFNVKYKIHEAYDLKGSSYGRNGGQSELKDNDWLKRNKKISLDPYLKKQFAHQIQKDSQFFSKNNINDYSLLVGIAEAPKRNKEQIFQLPSKQIFKSYQGGCLSDNQQEVYILSIIDILTQFGSGKNIEYLFKRAFIGEGVSCIPPEQYSQRFRKFIYESLQ